MAVGDVYAVQIELSGPDSPATINLSYQEVTPHDGVKTRTQALADALGDSSPVANLAAMISEEAVINGIYVRAATFEYQVSGVRCPPGFWTDYIVGGRSGDPLPANNGLRIGVYQSVFPARSNGMFWVPFIPEADVVGNTVSVIYAAVAVDPFLTSLGPLVEETPAAGQWRLGLLSRKFLSANPGDFEGAFADATGVSASPIIGTQRRRTTRRRGAGGS